MCKRGKMNFNMLLGEYEIKHDLIPSGQNFTMFFGDSSEYEIKHDLIPSGQGKRANY